MNVRFMVQLELRTAQIRGQRADIDGAPDRAATPLGPIADTLPAPGDTDRRAIALPDDTTGLSPRLETSNHSGRIALPNTGGLR